MSEDHLPERRVSIRPRAAADIEQCANYLEEHATPETALRFRFAIMDAIERVAAMPGVGSPRHLKNPRLSGLRMWIIPGFKNYLLFYVTPHEGVQIVRVFHGAQDVNAILETEE